MYINVAIIPIKKLASMIVGIYPEILSGDLGIFAGGVMVPIPSIGCACIFVGSVDSISIVILVIILLDIFNFQKRCLIVH